jgi:hypothetical protein
MKKLIYLFILIMGTISCTSNDETENIGYEFIKEYSTNVVVGGVVGISERTFKIGEINISALQKGMYFLSLKGLNGVQFSTKIFKE